MSETPSKADPESTSPTHLPKDRKCEFCGKDFTSSSLGRHLDLWIKETNPKPPDGIHDVNAIRKLRAHVTRRQYKKSLGSRRDSTASAATAAATPTPVATSRRSPGALESNANSAAPTGLRKESAAAIPGFNVHNFAVTGVINDFNKDTNHSAYRLTQELAAQQTRASQQNLGLTKKVQDAEDRARAAELALREMVSAWRAAKLHIDMNSTPFDFDPLTLDFPALTLQCLPPPPTLASLNPFSTDSSWSVQPPDEQQYTALEEYFTTQFRQWRIKCAAATTALQEDIQYPPPETALDDPQEAVRRAEKLADDMEKKVHDHIKLAYSRWEALPHQRRQDTWILELARSVGKKQQEIEHMQAEQHRLRQEAANLRSQIDQLNKLQQPREFKMMVPATLPVDQKFLEFFQEQAVVHGRRSVGMTLEDRRLDIGTAVNTAIERWLRVVTTHKSSGNGAGKRRAEQAELDEAGNGDSLVPSDRTEGMNKVQALSGEDGRPMSRAACGGTVPVLHYPENARGTNGVSSASSGPTSGAVGVRGNDDSHEVEVNVVDQRDGDRSDHDADAEKDDGMSDQDADADIEDDDAPGHPTFQQATDQQRHPRPSSTIPTQRIGQPKQLPGPASHAGAQFQVPLQYPTPANLAVGSNVSSIPDGTSNQPDGGKIRYPVA